MRFYRCIGIAVLTAGCGPSVHEVQLRQLTETVEKLRVRVARQDDRTATLSNRLIVLTDRLASQKRAAARSDGAAPDLEVVRLVPEKPAAAEPAPDPEPPAKPIEITLTGTPEPRKSASRPGTGANPEQLFRRALEAYRGGQGAVAYTRFSEFAQAFPRHDYADNARYWMGECRFESAQYREALSEFERVLSDYPRSKKAPDALLKIGLSYERLAMHSHARGSFERVIATYPHSALAELARSRLAASGKPKGAAP